MPSLSEIHAAAAPSAAVVAKPRVLVIDDELGPRESMRFLLKGEYDVFVADTVAGGLEQIHHHRPDVIVMDIRMPGMNGIEGLREIRKIDQNCAIIMLTGFGALETAQEAMRLGANDYMKKPFDASDMREAVRRNYQKVELVRKRETAQRDLAELNRQLASELQRKEHMASLGLASAGLVHDLRNPLTVIMGYIQLMSEDLTRQPASAGEHGEYVDVIRKSVKRCKELVESWLSISRSDSRKPVPVDLHALITQVANGLMPQAAERKAGIVCDIQQRDAVILGEETQLARVFQNLIVNALDSLSESGGRVEVSLARDAAGQHVIEIRDNGCGIPAAQIEHIFDPFHHTSKRDTGGTGLGLFIARRIVDDHKGTIRIASEPGCGTTVSMTFPAHAAAQKATA